MTTTSIAEINYVELFYFKIILKNIKSLNIIFYLIIIFLFAFQTLHAQMFPDYQERSFTEKQDSTAAPQNFYLTGSEGSVDPNEYIVGPGDKLFISISGIQDISLNLFINQQDYLFIPKVGGVNLQNVNLIKAKQDIKDAIDKYYKNVDVFVSLVAFRKIKVSIIGDVKKPASYIMPGNSRLMDLIGNSFGLTKTSDYRDIKITGRNGESKYYDFLKFLRFGNKTDNPLLQDGDVVYVDKVDKVISIRGEVKYPGIYEFVKNETVTDFIKLAGGLLSKAEKDSIEIVRFQPNGKTQKSFYYSFKQLDGNKMILHDQDMVIVRKIPLYFIDRYVEVTGWVKYPGYYKITEGKTTLEDIIKECGGFLKGASLEDASITRSTGKVKFDPEYEMLKNMQRKDMSDDEYAYYKAKSIQQVGKVVVNFSALFNNHDKADDIILRKGDIINVPEAKNYIIMLGQVVNPGNIIYQDGLTVDDYLKLAGGYGWRAEKDHVRVIRAATGEWVDAGKVDSLNPGDTIWVPEQPPPPRFWDVFTTALQVVGQFASIIAATVAIIVATRK